MKIPGLSKLRKALPKDLIPKDAMLLLKTIRIEPILLLVGVAILAFLYFYKQEGFESKPNELDVLIKRPEKTLVLFYADWCGHCKKMKPVWDETAEKVNKEKTRMVKVNVGDKTDEQEALIAKYKIDGFPTVMVFQNGKPTPYVGEYTEEMFMKILE